MMKRERVRSKRNSSNQIKERGRESMRKTMKRERKGKRKVNAN